MSTVSEEADRNEILRRTVPARVHQPPPARRQRPGTSHPLKHVPVGGPEVLLVPGIERRLVRGREQVRAEDVWVLQGKAGSLDAAAEHPLRVLVEVLIEGVASGDVEGERRVVAASGAAPLLPDGGNAPGITAADDGVERANVDPELQRARRDDAEEVPAEEAALYLAPLSGVYPARYGEMRRARSTPTRSAA